MKERRRDFYIASITEPKQEEKKETAQVQSPPSKPDTKPNEFISPFLGRQKNTVGTPPAVSYGNAGKQYEGYRKQRKLTPEEIRRQNASYVLNTEQYKQILKKGIIPQISEEPVAPKPSYRRNHCVRRRSKSLLKKTASNIMIIALKKKSKVWNRRRKSLFRKKKSSRKNR